MVYFLLQVEVYVGAGETYTVDESSKETVLKVKMQQILVLIPISR